MKNTIKEIHPHFDDEDVQSTIGEYNYYLDNNDAMICVRCERHRSEVEEYKIQDSTGYIELFCECGDQNTRFWTLEEFMENELYL